SATINPMKNEIQTGKTNDVNLKTCRKLWAANLLSRQLPPISYFAFIVGECRHADLPIAPSEGLCFCSTISIASLVLSPFRILCNAGLSTLEEQLCQLFERI